MPSTRVMIQTAAIVLAVLWIANNVAAVGQIVGQR